MGRKQVPKEESPKKSPNTKPAEDPTPEEPEEPQIVKDLKAVDDKYLALEREYEEAVRKLQKEFRDKQQPFLEQRTTLLTAASNESDGAATGTPALSGFWLQCLKHHPAFEEVVMEWDEPVLEFLKDITVEQREKKNFALAFHFEANPYFENTVLTKEYHLEEDNPYNGETIVKKIESDEVKWKAGKDVTVEKVAKKVKGGGAKKAKQKKEKEEPRDSIFRSFFRNLDCEGEMPEDLQALLLDGMDDDDDDEEDILDEFMENDYEIGLALRDNIVPFAVRWYTGEAAPEIDDDDEDEESEEDDDDDDESEDESEDDEPPARGRGGKPKDSPKEKKKDKKSPKVGPADGKEKEECKQQ